MRGPGKSGERKNYGMYYIREIFHIIHWPGEKVESLFVEKSYFIGEKDGCA